MNKLLAVIPKPVLKLLLLAICLASFAVFVVLIHSASQKSVLGADFFTFWMAGKALFLEHVNPYSSEVTNQIQLGKLGRLAAPGEDKMAFAYPPYSLVTVLPTIFFSFDWASSVWLSLNITIFSLILFAFPPKQRVRLFTSFLFFPIFLNFVLGTFDILASSGILLFFILMTSSNRTSASIQVLIGILLAWSTMKPQFTWLLAGFAIVYAVREKYPVFLRAFLISLATFLLFSSLLVSSWLSDWIRQVQDYTQYVQGRPTITEFLVIFFEPRAAMVISGLAFLFFSSTAVFLLFRWWKGRLHWLKITAWLGSMTYLFHLHGISYEQYIFLIPLILWAGHNKEWKSPTVLFFWVASILISWSSFLFGINNTAIDRSPVLFNLIWVVWLLRKPNLQL